MRYIPVTSEQREAMLRAVGVPTADSLFDVIPVGVRLEDGLNLPDGLGEMELTNRLKRMAGANTPSSEMVSFLGAGCYDHYIPSVVDHVISKPEFFTAYTPYQPEVSQGTLQAIYEYQSMICLLTGMDVSNASMYDGATALVEAALMACRVTKRHRVLVAGTVHPEWRETLSTYAEAGGLNVDRFGISGGLTDRVHLDTLLEAGDVAAVLVACPNFFGNLEDLEEIGHMAHGAGALLVVAANPILLGVLEPPSSFGADIVVGEGQPLGNPMSYGGPGLGFFACREGHVRQMPGRLVGRTKDVDGNMAFVLTLSTREQHIRREKATSNICSNHALNALTAGVYLAATGQQGLAGIAHTCVARAHYLRERLLATGTFSAPWDASFGYEFALTYRGDGVAMQSAMLKRGYLAGQRVADLAPELPAEAGAPDSELMLFAVTEKRSRAEIDAFVEEVASL
ncbi:MAG: aminomethyl-transferring glycine dehydrogenase subunit GcvPA [Coriobacteriia bacterium]|nr:aminomethyl-transferring glycine dehydrogenase subunit GcvPA [Coriobacteriia bacterium]